MIAADRSIRRSGVSSGAFGTQSPKDVDTPSTGEWWFVYIVLLLTAIVPGLTKYGLPDQTVVIVWSLAYVIAGWQLLRRKAQVLPIVRRSAALWALVFLMLVSTLWSVNPYATIIDSIELLGTTLVSFYIATRFTLAEFIVIIALMSATIAFVSLAMVFGNPGYGRAFWGTGPWQGIYLDKNAMGEAAALAIISQLALLPHTKGRLAWFLFAGILLSGLLLIGSNSETALGDCAAVVVIAFVAIACWASRFKGFARVATVLGSLIAVALIFAFGLTIDNVYTALGRGANLTGRSDFWPYLQQAIADRPLLGFGFGAFFQSPMGNEYLGAFVEQAGGWTPYHAHNSFLQAELDAGYVGFTMLIGLIVISFWRAVRYFAREPNSLTVWPLSIILFLTIGSFTETYFLNFRGTLDSILLVAAIVYPLRNSLGLSSLRGQRADLT